MKKGKSMKVKTNVKSGLFFDTTFLRAEQLKVNIRTGVKFPIILLKF